MSLRKKNDWGRLTFGCFLKKEDGSEDFQPFQAKDGQNIRIQWPNGTEQTVEVRLRKESESVSEHGSFFRHEVINEIPYFTLMFKGIEVSFDLERLKISSKIFE